MSDSLLDLADLSEGWLIELRGQRKSPATLKAYKAGVTGFLSYCAAQGIPPELTKPNVIGWVASMAESEAATARLRLTAVKIFARWVAEEEGVDLDAIGTVRPPKLDQKVVEHLTRAEIDAIIAQCGGTEMRDRRDKALIMLFAETGLRSAEMLALDLPDVSVINCEVLVRRGKGAKGRRVRFSAACATALDKYVRARRKAGHGETGPLWVGPSSRLSYTGMKHSLQKRATAAGVVGFHPHRCRHTSAVQWLQAGGSEAGLMARHGWSARSQIDRYVKSAAESLADEEFDRLNLGFGDIDKK